ncbi:MAG: hypothetical protein WDN47_00355 [Candidatus Doudnabacteria bacterium]
MPDLKTKLNSIGSVLIRNFFAISLCLIILVIAGEITVLTYKKHPVGTDRETSSLNNYADQIIGKCSDERYHPACYDKEIPKLMDVISMEDAFKVTAIIQSKDSTYPYCHVLGHELSAREVDKDPTKWKDVIARLPSGVCSNGGIHGALQEEFRSETFTPKQVAKIKPELVDLCEKRASWNPTGLEQGSCYHALGHLTMYLTNADIPSSVAMCNELAKKPDGRDYSELCYDGAFMQIFQPLEPEDKELIAGKEVKEGHLTAYCEQFTGNVRSSCWSEGWPLVYNQIMQPQGLVAHCSDKILQSPDDSDRCFLSLFYIVTAQMSLDGNLLDKFCSALPAKFSGQCYSDAAGRMVETDYKNIPTAVQFCGSASTAVDQQACYGDLVRYSTYNFHSGSEQFNNLCNNMPEDWKTRCFANS